MSKLRNLDKTSKRNYFTYLLVTAAFLAWSFIGKSWDISWIIWPIAGVLYGAVTAVIRVLKK